MKRFALAGNPNCGKTTLFNSLTGSTAHVGNWPGVMPMSKSLRLILPSPRTALTTPLSPTVNVSSVFSIYVSPFSYPSFVALLRNEYFSR